MDMKGITWIGNIYQKFEAMCLEVEEGVYEDTVKYVENQVHTVGDSVKKFYSDVMQDFLPPFSIDPVKEAVSESHVEPNNDVGNHRKPKVGLKGKGAKVDDTDQMTEDQKRLTDNNPDHPPASHELCRMENLFPVPPRRKRSLSRKLNPGTIKNFGTLSPSPNETFKDSVVRLTLSSEETVEVDDIGQLPGYPELAAGSDSGPLPTSRGDFPTDNLFPIFQGDSGRMAPRRHSKGCLYNKSSLGSNKSSRREKLSPNEQSRLGTSGHRLNRLTSSCGSLNNNHEASCNQKSRITTPLSIEIIEHESAEENRNEIENEQMPDDPTNKTPSARINLFESHRGEGIEMRLSSCGSSLEESNESTANGSMQCSKFNGEEYSDEWDTDVNKDGIAGKQETEIMHQAERTKLEETCVMVNRDEFHFVPHSGGESKPCKKNIGDVFSRKRSMRKQEYKQLARRYISCANVDQEVKSSISTITGEESPSRDFFESDWELL